MNYYLKGNFSDAAFPSESGAGYARFMSHTAERKPQHLLEMGAVHTEPITRFFAIARLEFLAALR
jgi:hypothetical protein